MVTCPSCISLQSEDFKTFTPLLTRFQAMVPKNRTGLWQPQRPLHNVQLQLTTLPYLLSKCRTSRCVIVCIHTFTHKSCSVSTYQQWPCLVCANCLRRRHTLGSAFKRSKMTRRHNLYLQVSLYRFSYTPLYHIYFVGPHDAEQFWFFATYMHTHWVKRACSCAGPIFSMKRHVSNITGVSFM